MANLLGVAGLIVNIVSALIMIPLNALLLMVSTKIFKLSDSSYMTAIKVTLILGIASVVFTVIGYFLPTLASILYWIAILIVSVVLGLWLIKSKYELDWGKAALVWLVWFVLSLIVGFVIAFIIGIAIIVIGLGALASAAAGG